MEVCSFVGVDGEISKFLSYWIGSEIRMCDVTMVF